MTERLRRALADLERVWAEHDVPIRHHLQSGLTDAEIDRAMAPTGLTLPEEAREWWRWHNGVPNDTPDYARRPGSDVFWCSLSEAVRYYTMLRAVYAEEATELIDPWRPEWFVLCYGQLPNISQNAARGSAVTACEWRHNLPPVSSVFTAMWSAEGA